MGNVFFHLRSIKHEFKHLSDDAIEHATINLLLSSPYERIPRKQAFNIVNDDYFPGLFYISEREKSPDFLFDENHLSYEAWIRQKLFSEITQLEKDNVLKNSMLKYGGVHKVLDYCEEILRFKTSGNQTLESLIINQEYSDIFRRIVVFILVGNPFYIYNNHQSFNELGKKQIPSVLEKMSQYSLRDQLFLTIASGMIGMDIKDSLIHTSPVNLTNSLDLNSNNPETILDGLDEYIHTSGRIGIDSYNEFISDIRAKKPLKITWFTDDYIETMFELKFIENIMNQFDHLIVTVVPRYDSYSNDASYKDIIDLMQQPVFSTLMDYCRNDRLKICRDGMDLSTVDFFRMSKELYGIMIQTDLCVISGARAYEMTQGLKIKTYYTGIAVCKSYTESITGFSKNNGALIFLAQDKGAHSFERFRDRASRILTDGNETIHVAGVTAKEYHEKRQKQLI